MSEVVPFRALSVATPDRTATRDVLRELARMRVQGVGPTPRQQDYRQSLVRIAAMSLLRIERFDDDAPPEAL